VGSTPTRFRHLFSMSWDYANHTWRTLYDRGCL
jgi:hypothetical protein